MVVGRFLHIRVIPSVGVAVVRPFDHIGQEMLLIRCTEENLVDDLHGLVALDVLVRAECAVLIAIDQATRRRAVDIRARPAAGDIRECITGNFRCVVESRRDRRKLRARDRRVRAERAVLIAGENTGVGQRRDRAVIPGTVCHIGVAVRARPHIFAGLVLKQTVEDRCDLRACDLALRLHRAVRITADIRIVLVELQRRGRQLVVLDGEHERDVRSRFLERIAHRGVNINGHVQIDRIGLRADLGNEDVALEAIGRIELAEELRGLVGRDHDAVFRHGHADVIEHIVVRDGGAFLGGGVAVDLGAQIDLCALHTVLAVSLHADGLREAVAGHAVGEVREQVRARTVAGVGEGEARAVAVRAVIVRDGGNVRLARRPDAQSGGQRDHQHEGDDHGKFFVFHTVALLMPSGLPRSTRRLRP